MNKIHQQLRYVARHDIKDSIKWYSIVCRRYAKIYIRRSTDIICQRRVRNYLRMIKTLKHCEVKISNKI